MTPSERLLLFFAAMTDWERTTFAGMTSGANSQEDRATARAALAAIYDAHLSAKGKALNRWGMRLAGPNSGSPPQYDQEVTKIEDGPKKSTVYAYTKHNTLPDEWWRYSVVLEANGDPRIDDLRVAFVQGGEWKRGMY